MTPVRFLRRLCPAAFAFLACVFTATLPAQTPATGAIEGRVQNGARGEYLENALVTIEGTGLETRTDETGLYRFSKVPPGTVTVKASYTGFPVQSAPVVITVGQFAQRDFDLSAKPKPAASDGVVTLDAFVISTSKEMDAAAIALNEKRAAANIVNVIAAAEFGDNPDGNVGEFLKFLPGVQVDTAGGEPRFLSLSGTGSGFLPITTGGFNVASAASSGTGRTIELEQLSMNNVARVEINFSQTPESPGGAIGGSVNLVPRSAFERSKPSFNSNVFFMFRDNDRHFRASPGPLFWKTPKVNPGAEFSWVVPVNKRFGFTLSAARTMQFSPQDGAFLTWQGAGVATNGTTFPHTTAENPYLTTFSMRDGVKNTERDSLGATFDFKLGRYDSLSVGLQWALFDAQFNDRSVNWNVGSVSVGNFDAYHTHGNVGAGTFNFGGSARDKAGTTWTSTVRWRHNGPIWKMDAGLSHSNATNHYRDIDKGWFNGINVRRTGVTIRFDDNWYLRPGKITVLDGTTGAPIDTSRIENSYINNFSSSQLEGHDIKQSFQASISRSFMLAGDRRIPLTLKLGTAVDHSRRDTGQQANNYTWVGPDGVAHNGNPNTATSRDDNGAQILDQEYYKSLPFGFGMSQFPNHQLAYTLYKEHPTWFTTDVGSNNEYLSIVNNSKLADEINSAAYLRFDVAFLRANRLKFTGGYRAEQTNISGQGPSNDPTANYQRDANGNVLRGPTGAILLKVPTSDALGVSKLTRLYRGTIAKKEYIRFFPSINGDYAIVENLHLKFGWSQSVGRPDFNQYAGGITLPDTETNPPPGNPNVAAGRISVNNVGLKPQNTNSINVALDYYFPRGIGNLSLSGFRRNIRNFNTTIQYYPEANFYALYGLDEEIYGGYPVSTQVNNANKVQIEGFDFSYRQGLDPVLPQWARGISVFANMSTQRQTGEQRGSFSNNRPRQYKWGVSISRPKFNIKMNWSYQAKRQRGAITGSSVPAETYNWDSKRMYIDLNMDYYFRKNMAIYAAFRNLNDATEDNQRYSEKLTPLHARFTQRLDFGSLWTMGIRSTF